MCQEDGERSISTSIAWGFQMAIMTDTRCKNVWCLMATSYWKNPRSRCDRDCSRISLYKTPFCKGVNIVLTSVTETAVMSAPKRGRQNTLGLRYDGPGMQICSEYQPLELPVRDRWFLWAISVDTPSCNSLS